MYKLLKESALFFVLLLISTAAFAAQPEYLRLSHTEGDVQIKIPEGSDWGPAVINGPLAEGDQVWIPRGSRAEIQLAGGALIRLDGNSALQVLASSSGASQFHLSQGGAYVYTENAQREVIQIDTPEASVRAHSNAVFRIDLTDRATDVAVYKGTVETENRLGQTRVPAGKMLSLGQQTSGSLAPLGPPDAWERWNTARNDLYRARTGTSTRYLPEELKGYARDFDTGGRWVNVPEYGNVWTPTVIVIERWAPYRHGRWIWRHGHYIWLPYDPWGWAPYHYGRWTYVTRYGWCWVPPAPRQVFWGPGYVGWVRSGSYIGWVPLAPGEIYYGRGQYGPHSVNITNVNVNHIKVTNVYRNVTVNNGATVVNRDHFQSVAPKGTGYDRHAHRDLFGRNNISVGGPEVKPGLAHSRWSDRKIAVENAPPQAVQKNSVSDLRQQRPLVREPERSVFRRGEPVRNMPVTSAETPSMPRRGGEPTHRTDSPPSGKPGLPESGVDQKRPSDLSPAGKPGTPDPRVPSGRDTQRFRQPEVPAVPSPGDRRVPQDDRRTIRTPDPVRPGATPGVRPDDRIRDRQEQREDRRGLQQNERRRDARPAETPAFESERRQERQERPAQMRDDKENLPQQDRHRPGGFENQQPGQRDRMPGNPGIQPERGRPGGRDGSFDFNKNRQQLHAVQRTKVSNPERVTEQKSAKPPQRPEQSPVRTQAATKTEQKNEKQQTKEKRGNTEDNRMNKDSKDRGKHEDRGL
ncbi:MAG: FecR domain protein [Nitrospirae bacterium]|nr:MAG: FecR domain protein [Nitrospirota bacterium]